MAAAGGQCGGDRIGCAQRQPGRIAQPGCGGCTAGLGHLLQATRLRRPGLQRAQPGPASDQDRRGTPFNFRPEYSTASTANQGGWAAANINVAYEVGHFTPCTKLKVFAPINVFGHLDKSWNFCGGPYENTGPPDGSPGSGETNDAPCFPAGDTHGSFNSDPNLVTGCTGGDLDYDGTSYWRNWPSSTTPNMWPSPLTFTPPTTGGAGYSQMQFLTDNPASSITCNTQTGAGCVVPPTQAPGKFYPYWTLAKVNGTCAWEFGQMTNGNSFGADKQYGTFPTALGLAELASKIMPNPHC